MATINLDRYISCEAFAMYELKTAHEKLEDKEKKCLKRKK